jgi:hypothetical protein
LHSKNKKDAAELRKKYQAENPKSVEEEVVA